MVSQGLRAASPGSSDRYIGDSSMKRSHLHHGSPYKPGSAPRYPTPSTRRGGHNIPEARESSPGEELDGENVCDYDSSPTQLYELLESSSWERARTRCRSHPEEVRTWIVRKDKSHAVRWRLLPLHAAIIFQAPNFLVSALLEQYPHATARQDDQGMLPLHLAFRHKHEDEDLLELLLGQNPKAVVMKDRRDRIPLEHGRESKFGAKLMRLYADAVVVSTRLVGGKSGGVQNASTPTYSNVFGQSSQTMTVGDRARLDQDHKNEIKALTLKYENQIRKLKNISGEQLQSLEGDTEYRISMLQADYEKQITQLRESHTSKIADLQETNHIHIRRIEQASQDARQTLEDRHKREIQDLRDMLNNQINRDKELSDALEKEIAHLQVALQDRKNETEMAALQATKLLDENERLQDVMANVQEQQAFFQELDMEESRAIRQKVAETLLRQDKEEKTRGHGTRMLELTESLRRKIDVAMEQIKFRTEAEAQKARLESHLKKSPSKEQRLHTQRQQQHSDEPDPEEQEIHSIAPRVSNESRIERDRWETSHDEASRLERAREELKIDEKRSASLRSHSAKGMPRAPEKRSDEDEKRSLLSRRREQIQQDKKDDGNRKFGEVRVVADEISAITTHSDFY